MRSVAIAALAMLAMACGRGDPGPAATSSPASPTKVTTTTATATAATPGALADEWDKKLDLAVKTTVAQPCARTTVRTSTCAVWLTGQVEAVSSLDASLRARTNSSRYTKTLVNIEKVLQASEAYAKDKCYAGGGTEDDCWTQAWLIGMGVLTVKTSLRADDLTP